MKNSKSNRDLDSTFRSSGLNTGLNINLRTGHVSGELNNWVYTRYSRPFSSFEDARVHTTLASSVFDFTHDGQCVYTHQQKSFLKALQSATPPTKAPPTSASLSLNSYGNISSYGGTLALRTSTFALAAQMQNDYRFSFLIKKELWNGGRPLAALCRFLFPQDEYGQWVRGMIEQQKQQQLLASSLSPPILAHTHMQAHSRIPTQVSKSSHIHGPYDACAQEGYGISPHDIATLPASDTPIVNTSDPYEIRTVSSLFRTPHSFNHLISTAPVWNQPLFSLKLALAAAQDGEMRSVVGFHYCNANRDIHMQVGWSPDRVTHMQFARELLPKTFFLVNILRYPPIIAPPSSIRAQPLHTHFAINVAKTFTKTTWEVVPDPEFANIPNLELSEAKYTADKALVDAQALVPVSTFSTSSEISSSVPALSASTSLPLSSAVPVSDSTSVSATAAITDPISPFPSTFPYSTSTTTSPTTAACSLPSASSVPSSSLYDNAITTSSSIDVPPGSVSTLPLAIIPEEKIPNPIIPDVIVSKTEIPEEIIQPVPTILVPIEQDWCTIGIGASRTGVLEASAEVRLTENTHFGATFLIDREGGYISGWSLWKD